MKKFASVLVISLLVAGTAAWADVVEPGLEDYSGYDCAGDGNPMPEDGSCGPGVPKIETWLENNVLGFSDLDELYKYDVGEGESGILASLFDAEIGDQGGIIGYSGSDPFQATWLLVKDGVAEPIWYLFDISGWDPLAVDLYLQNFWFLRKMIA